MSLKTNMLCLLLVSLHSLLIAQTANRDTIKANIEAGFKAGMNYSGGHIDAMSYDLKGKPGFAGGGFISFGANRRVGFQVEAMYAQKGFRATGIMINKYKTYPELNTRTHYIDIALLGKLNFGTVSIVAGPQYSVLVAQQSNRIETTYYAGTNHLETDSTQQQNTSSVGFTAGIDVYLNRFVLSPRVGMNFFNTSKPIAYTNRWAQLCVGYKFGLKGKP